MYARESPTEPQVIDEWPDGVGWVAHPDEGGRRASHAVRADDGVWLFDPIDAPGVDNLVTELGDVAGVAVLSGYHARDADAFARRYDVPVHVPAWIDRAAARVDAPVERVDGSVAGFDLRAVSPLGAWDEAVAYRESDGTLYVPDVISAAPDFTVGGERMAVSIVVRLTPPRAPFADADPDRVLFGHGSGVFDDAADALAASLDGARRRFPRALVSTAPRELRAMLGALR
ncbi:hypothetical protein [Halostella litorea]|uniref:hypothetical protein n=1 Tax=Halostella litorea TaxID=2528831 RepID=UPI002872FE42|nr:hypothetical protein [Halostella litorea]